MREKTGLLLRLPAALSRMGAVLASCLLVMAMGTGLARAEGQAPTVILIPRPDYGGLVLADPDGWTLYTWDGDAPGESYCYDECAALWPPYTITGELIPPDDLPASLGLIDRGDGTWQVTIDNWPLYYFVGDTAPGDVNGDGSLGFGARWYVNVFVAPAEPVGIVPPAPEPILPLPPVQPPVVTAPPPVVVQPAPTPAPARNVPVSIVEYEFRPPVVNIQVGDTVVWTNNGRLAHTSTSDTGLWDSGRLNAGQSYSRTFTSPGTFPYHCAIHPNQRGTVVVAPAGAPVAGPGGPGGAGTPYDQLPFYGPGVSQPPYGFEPYPQPAPPPGGYVPPGFVPMPTATATSSGTVSLTWVPVGGAVSYRIYATLASSPLNLTVVHTVSQSPGGPLVGQATISGLSPGATYLFQVRAVDANGIETVVPSASAGTPPAFPGAGPGPLSVSGTTNTTVVLSWSALPGAVSYRVLQASSPTGPFTLSSAGTVTTTSAVVTGLTPNTTYYFQVVPVDAAGNPGPPTNTVSATTAVALAPPSGLTGTSTAPGQVTLAWNPSVGATSYRVLIATNANGPFTIATNAIITASGATIPNLAPNTTYFFQVVAVDATGNQSPPSTTVAVTTMQ